MSTKKKQAPSFNPYDLDHMAKTWGEMMRMGNDFAKIWAEQSNTQNTASIPTDPFNIGGIYQTFWDNILQNPEKLSDAQATLWENYVTLCENTIKKISGGDVPEDLITPEPGDRRFKADAWTEDVAFDFIKQSYLLTAKWLLDLVEGNTDTLNPHEAQKLNFFTRQLTDALAPTNFAFLNPEVLQETVESGGENLVKGMQNFMQDIQRGHGMPNMRMTDEDAFKLGKNIARTKGNVVFRNRYFELIHYTPVGETVFETPLLILPPWINKYYILDLRADNSFVSWALEQGHNVYMISWVNPDASFKGARFDDYMRDGVLTALAQIEKQTGTKETNVIGYCIGGTLLSMTLAWLKAKKQQTRVKSATFLTTLIDFENAGDLKLFVDEDQIDALTERMNEQGYMDAQTMKGIFSMLRANDLIWTFVINNYMMGKEPFPFDLLFWNSDATNLPASMHEYYLRHMYLANDLVKPGALEVDGVAIDVGSIDTPAYFLSAREDHIAPWKATYDGSTLFSGPKTFTLAASGHIAGVINHPNKNKYCYWENAKHPKTADDWMNNAKQKEGSWWPNWQQWVDQYAGKKVKSPKKPQKSLCSAPGEYVKVKA